MKSPLIKSVFAELSHKIFSVITVPVNYLSFGIAFTGISCSCLLASIKISIYLFSGYKIKFPTAYSYFSNTLYGSIYHIFATLQEVSYEYYYRITTLYDKVLYNEGPNSDTFYLVQKLNDKRIKLHTERSFTNWTLHKLISIVNIPINIGSSIISFAGATLTAPLGITKIALYILLGLQIKGSTGFVFFGSSCITGIEQTIQNISEICYDHVLLIRDMASFLNMHGAMERIQDFVNNAFARFVEALCS